jgi:outer membrane lipoprotein-sorting protein
MTRRLLLIFLTLGMLCAPARAAPQELSQIADYFAAIENLQADFLQIGPKGETARGVFYYRKPGHMRFSYNPPNGQVVIAGDTWLTIQKQQGKEANYYPLKASPLGRFIASRERLDKTDYLSSFDVFEGRAVITLMDKDKPRSGRLELMFSFPQIALLGWRVSDMQQQITQIHLAQVQQPASLPNLLFFVDESETEFD